MALLIGDAVLASTLADQAERLRVRFEESFWCPDIGTYALALDGEKRPCCVVASNAGHALFARIAAPDRARRVAETLLGPDSFSGWGIRTLALGQPRYNPMSYHNGSVWPHDNALIAMGFAHYGLKSETSRVSAAIFDAAGQQELSRLPELFCGFGRRPHRPPTPYPVACSPQAWAAASVFGLLSASLGLELLHEQGEVRLRDPVMPDFLDEMVIRNLRIGTSRLDVRLHRYGHDITANVLSRRGSSRVSILK
jgi:glycogen debranching enzyme